MSNDGARRIPRIGPIDVNTVGDETKAVFDAVSPFVPPTNVVVSTLMWSPELTRLYMPFSDYLKNAGRLPPRDRELLILRTAWNCGADYQWVVHQTYGLRNGLNQEDFERIAAGPVEGGWDEFEAAVLRACDELHAQRRVSNETWAMLETRYEQSQLIELLMLVGNYEMIAMVMNSVRISPPGEVADLPGNRFTFAGSVGEAERQPKGSATTMGARP
jgi:4-carboxymuconolactone decarboxylase